VIGGVERFALSFDGSKLLYEGEAEVAARHHLQDH
jgi:hypothetical protein